ncbi:hypothetical protein ACFORH_00285 [Amycolatopsis roodepoortensis]|uniref:Uncharacterized protein n=1 Tax=Amycolatopsis roodepoortensis TaxID=700274 RepID=A0ABR9L3V7_9PSEU|nr:hypothetical protein [Amycolatopsis roodepoortensis]MBE1575424.1 hypothetical protein [Amycolatopsis roodepoortensis]
MVIRRTVSAEQVHADDLAAATEGEPCLPPAVRSAPWSPFWRLGLLRTSPGWHDALTESPSVECCARIRGG